MENQENIFKIANNIMSERNEKEFRRDGEIETPNRLNDSKTSSKEIMDKIRYVVCILLFCCEYFYSDSLTDWLLYMSQLLF